jgi:hypothetical protein
LGALLRTEEQMFEKENLIEQLGTPYTKFVVERFKRFVFIPTEIINTLAHPITLQENWGIGNFVLEKYLAVHIPWSIEQGHYTYSSNQFYTTAGHLQTRYGTPVYLVFEKNRIPNQQPWCIVYVGAQISAPELPTPPEIPTPPLVPLDAEIVMLHDHILGGNACRVPFLSQTPSVAQICAVAGAIKWSIHRGLQMAYWYFGKMNYLVPIYLQNREDITRTPDLIAPVQVNPDSLLVRTALEPYMPYANARVAVRRHDQLPSWLLDAWSEHAEGVTESQIEDPEGEKP